MLRLVRRRESPCFYVRGTLRLPDGRSVEVKESTGCTERVEAEVYLEACRQRIRAEHDRSSPRSLGFGDAVASYSDASDGLHPFDVTRLEKLTDHFEDWDVADIDGAAFREFCQDMLPGTKPSTRNRYRSNLVAVLNHANQHFSGIVVRKIPAAKTEPPKPIFLEIKKRDKLLSEYAPLVRPLFLMLCFQGCRVGEALRLHWSAVDLDSGHVTFRDTKNGDSRRVPMHERVHDALRGINREREGEVFHSHLGRPFRDHSLTGGTPVRAAHAGACKRAGVEGFSVHKWRSHWASWMVMHGASTYQLMRLGGWRSPDSVKHYVSLSDDSLKEVVNRA